MSNFPITIKSLITQAGLAYNHSNTSKVYAGSGLVNSSLAGVHLIDSSIIISNTQLNNTFFIDMKLIYRFFG